MKPPYYEMPESAFTSGPYVSDRLFDLRLGPMVSVVYIALWSLDGDDRTGVVWPTVHKIARLTNVSETSARKALRELERRGLITIRRRPGETNVYRLHDLGLVVHELPEEANQS